MSPSTAAVVVVVLAIWLAAYVGGLLLGVRGRATRARIGTLARRLTRRRRPGPVPTGRPIEAIAADLRRLGPRFHALAPRAPYVKVVAVVGAYDRVLGEACDAFGFPHLLGVLALGPDRDAERTRVERLLGGTADTPPRAA
jgi:hypothetical protein